LPADGFGRANDQGIVTSLLIAARNLARNRRRGAAALLTIGIAVVSMIIADGFAQWIFWAMREGTIRSQLGHIEAVRPGYFDTGIADPFAYIIADRAPEREQIEKTPGVSVVAPRLSVAGLVSHGDTTISFIGDGVDPAKEKELSKAFRIVRGHDLTGAAALEVLLGQVLARNLGVGPGETIALLANTASGGINAVEATVAGEFTTANQAYDDAALRLPIGLAQSLLRVKGAHMWLVLLDETERTDAELDALRARFPQASHRLQFVPWYSRADFYNKTVALFSRQMGVLRAIIGVIIVLSISNMLAMSVMERTGEIGTLLALGFRRREILVQFALEGLLLGIAGGAAGTLVGCALAEMISAIGIPMPPPPGMTEGYTASIRLTIAGIAEAFAIGFATTLAAGLYPAWKASRLPIVDSLRRNI
jgi:putative ABC transport system permease protein